MSRRSSDTLPVVGASAPARICSSVVLPAPFGPMIASSSPGAALNETSCSARRAPYDFESDSARSASGASVRDAAILVPG